MTAAADFYRASWGVLAAAFSESDVVTLLVGLLIIAVLTAAAYAGGRAIGRPREGSWVALVVLAVGVILLLLTLL